MLGSAANRNSAFALALLSALLARPALAVDVGDGDRARPALARVGVPTEGRAGRVAAAADLGGGITESLTETDSAHTRAYAAAAASLDAKRWLNLGMLVKGRYDRHASSDDGFLFQSELSARLAWRLGQLGLGFDATAWLPGGPDLGTSLSALGADGRLLLSHNAEKLVVAGFAGYRLDRSAEAAKDAGRLSVGDRSALDASDFDAALLGIGLGYSAGRTLLFGEATAQLLLGGPALAESPLRLGAGVRRPVGPRGLSLEVSFQALLSSRPDVTASARLVPIEPRALLNLGVRYRFGEPEPTSAGKAPPPPPPPPPPVKPPPPPAPPSSVELSLRDDQGQPLQNAAVVIVQGERETALAEASPGHYRLENAEVGKARLRVTVEGFQPVEREIEIGAGRSVNVDVQAQQALPAGQVRGLVRSFRGKPLLAHIRVEPAGLETSTDASGFFQIDVPPGEYEIVIEAPSYQAQRRKAKVEKQGVVIVNADLGRD